MPEPHPRIFYADTSDVIAKKILGSTLIYKAQSATIIETEAYQGSNDPASHAYRGKTPRNQAMFNEGGYAYLYLIYGMHLCFNITTSPENVPGSVFIRGIQIDDEIIIGPGRLTKRLGLSLSDQNRCLYQDPKLQIYPGLWAQKNQITAHSRIGIKHGLDLKWRFKIHSTY